NMQAVVPAAYAVLELKKSGKFDTHVAMDLYAQWVEWDKDRALDECIQHFYLASSERKASIASMLGGVLFQACNYDNAHHVVRAEKILSILMIPEYYYILNSYLEAYCVKRLTKKGNNLLKLLDDCGINPNIGVNPVATGL
ncbi:MAG: ankyrin repeat domain-containing protein, partial [Legionellales bacterium]